MLMLLLVLVCVVSAKDFKPMLGGGLGIESSDKTYFVFRGEGMLPVYKAFHARATFLHFKTGENTTRFTLCSGMSVDAIYMFPMDKMTPYGLASFNFTSSSTKFEGYSSTSTSTDFTILIGAGLNYPLKNAPVIPFGELGIGIWSRSTGNGTSNSDSETVLKLTFGVRINLGK
jgi:hypothetical protein